jgi:two-component system sensor histidine kinase KdpD
MEPRRPDPDQLLAQLKSEEAQQARGRLKIFLGYAAGVGKTYAMLEAAHQRKAEGVDVVIGYVETHRRSETEALVAGLEIIPRHRIDYRGITLEEMDVDAVLARHPQLALVDELAHTNAAGSRHPKRFQDVEELLAAGIDVYSTLNIQHLESLNDVVSQITNVVVRETIPDRVLDEVSEIELIDLPPDELLTRLREGKVYVPEQAARAIEEFFRKGNLTALRELTMRRAAERVDDQMRSYMRTRSIPGPWAARERLLVCVTSHPLSERLVRAARRLADELNAPWTVLHVELPQTVHLSAAQREQLAITLRLAEELGAKTVQRPGQSATETILDYARRHNITKIIIGKPLRPRWLEWVRGSVVEQLIRASGPIDVYVISGDASDPKQAVGRDWVPHRPWRRYAGSVALVAAVTVLSEFIQPVLSPINLVMFYLAAVVFAAVYLGRGPSMLTALLSVLAFDFFFVPPRFTFTVTDTEYILTFIGLFIVGMVISTLAVQSREQAEAARAREAETASLYSFSRDLAAAVTLDEIVSIIVTHLGENFSRQIVVLLPENGTLELSGYTPDTPRNDKEQRAFSNAFTHTVGSSAPFQLDENERAVAIWAFEHGEPAGRDTDTLPATKVRYLPLKTSRGVVGVLGVQPHETTKHMTPEQRRLMEAFANQAALAIERVRLAGEAQQARLQIETEQLRNSLLSSVSHDLRTPLAAITGAASSLMDEDKALEPPMRHEMAQTIYEEAERLNRLLRNLLDMTRLESGALHVNKELQPLEEVIGAALSRLEAPLADRAVNIRLPADLPFVPIDSVLIEQVFINLLENAIKYTPAGSPIDLSASADGAEVVIEVADRGPGLPPGDEQRIFEKFYRARGSQNGSGVGLGLTICRGVIEAHGGRIWAENRSGGGAVFRFTLPIEPEGKAA